MLDRRGRLSMAGEYVGLKGRLCWTEGGYHWQENMLDRRGRLSMAGEYVGLKGRLSLAGEYVGQKGGGGIIGRRICWTEGVDYQWQENMLD